MSPEELDPATAAALLAQTGREVSDQLTVDLPALYSAWGVAWLVGLGTMWLTVRDQTPYVGPSGWATGLLIVLLAGAAVVTTVVIARATHGISGVSERQGRYYGWSWALGFTALFSLEGALQHHGADAVTSGLVSAGGPMLVTGLLYLSGAAILRQPSMLYLGAWLTLLAGVGAWTGPITLLLLAAVGGGGGLLVAAALTSRRTAQDPG